MEFMIVVRRWVVRGRFFVRWWRFIVGWIIICCGGFWVFFGRCGGVWVCFVCCLEGCGSWVDGRGRRGYRFGGWVIWGVGGFGFVRVGGCGVEVIFVGCGGWGWVDVVFVGGFGFGEDSGGYWRWVIFGGGWFNRYSWVVIFCGRFRDWGVWGCIFGRGFSRCDDVFSGRFRGGFFCVDVIGCVFIFRCSYRSG